MKDVFDEFLEFVEETLVMIHANKIRDFDTLHRFTQHCQSWLMLADAWHSEDVQREVLEDYKEYWKSLANKRGSTDE